LVRRQPLRDLREFVCCGCRFASSSSFAFMAFAFGSKRALLP
jgi:hypothetical protein